MKSIGISAAIALVCLLGMSFQAAGAVTNSAVVGMNRVSVTAGTETRLGFVPAATGDYSFHTLQGDTYGKLYDASMTLLAEDDDSGNEYNFHLGARLTAGKQYYIGISDTISETVTVVIAKAEAKSGKCGANATWSYRNGVLTIAGTGPMYGYDEALLSSKLPWFLQTPFIREIVIENGVTTIGPNAFSETKALTTLSLPSTLKTIGSYAFFESGVANVTLPANLTGIGDYAFAYGELDSIRIPASTKTFGAYVFEGTPWLLRQDGFVVQNGTLLRYLGQSSEVAVPNTVAEIAGGAFNFCDGIRELTVPVSVVTIGKEAFANCIGLEKLTIHAKLRVIPGKLCSQCLELRELSLTKGCIYLDPYAFEGCTSLNSVVLPDGLQIIGEGAFAYCPSLTDVTIPKSVTTIGEYAFFGTALSSVTLPEQLRTIGKMALAGTDLKQVVIRDLAESIGDGAVGRDGAGKPVSGFVVYGYRGSEAEAFAKRSGLKFVGLRPQETSITAIEAGNHGITLSWKKSSYATAYYIYRAAPGGDFKYHGQTTMVLFTDGRAVPGTAYRYKVLPVRVLVNGTVVRGVQSAEMTCTACPKTPQHLIGQRTADKTVRLSWEAVDGARGYYVYRAAPGGSYVFVGGTMKTEFTDTTPGTSTYFYKVKAYIKDSVSGNMLAGSLSDSVCVAKRN